MLTKQDKKYIANLMDNKLDEKLDEKLTKFRSDILNHVDAVMGEVKAMREDFAILNHRTVNHEERITSLEENLALAI